MGVTAYSLPKIMEEEIGALVKAGYYSSKSDVMKDAFRTFLSVKTELRLASAVELYKEEKVSLSKAAEIAGVTTVEFKEVLADRGIIRETAGKPLKKIDKKLKRLLG